MSAAEQARFEARWLERYHRRHGHEVHVEAVATKTGWELQCEELPERIPLRPRTWRIGITERHTMTKRTTNSNQTTLPGADPGNGKRDRNGPLSLGDVVKRLVDLDRGIEAEIEAAVIKLRAKRQKKAAEKRAMLLARLPNDADRDMAERVVTAALKAMREAKAEAPVEQLALPERLPESTADTSA